MLSELLTHGHAIRILRPPKAPVALHCMAVSAGYEQRQNEVYSWHGLQRGTSPFVVVQHTLVGEGRLDFAGAQFRLRPGDTMVLTMPHDHRYWLERGGHWEYFWMVLNGREALRLAREVIDARGPVLRPQVGAVDRLAGACLALVRPHSAQPGEISAAAYAAMAALNDAAFSGVDEIEPDIPPALRRVMAHVQANIAAPLQIDRLAALAELSRAHFVRTFTAQLGVSPSAWVMGRRLERIERLLIATDLTIAAIAEATGFADANYLAKAFRRHRGVSPLEFRSAGRGHDMEMSASGRAV
jgi:AraC family transcriptional regulator